MQFRPRLLLVAILALTAECAPPSSVSPRRASGSEVTWADTVAHHFVGDADYTRCGTLVHIWVSPDINRRPFYGLQVTISPFRDRADTLLLHDYGDENSQDGCLSLIDVARETGVQQFVYTSFPPMGASFPLQDAKRAVEARLRDSGLTYTILRPTYFTEVWLSPAVGFDHANFKAAIYGTGENAISWISFLDVARFAVASLDNPVARNTTLDLGGPEKISPHNVVKIFEKVGGKAFELTHVPVDSLQGQLAAATDPMQRSFIGLMLGYAGATAIDMTAALKTFPLKLRPVGEYAGSVMV